MTTENQRRFRRRGGAKKKKKPLQNPSDSKPADRPPQPSKPVLENDSRVYRPMSQELQTSVDGDLQNYLLRLYDDLNSLDPTGRICSQYNPSDDDDPPPPVLLARNSLRELAPRIQELARDNAASRLLETLFLSARDAEAVAVVLDAILSLGSSRVAALAQHHSASHVFEKLVRLLKAEIQLPVLSDLARVVSEWTAAELVQLMQNSSGSHALRIIIATVSGLPEDEPREAKLDDTNPSKIRSYVDTMAVEVPKEWHASVCSVVNKLLENDENIDLSSMLWRPASCIVLQSLMAAVSASDKDLARRLAEAAIKGNLDELMHNVCGNRFIERAVLCLGSGFIFSSVQGRLKELAQDPKANFCVQRILFGLRGRGPVMNAWDELEESIPNMLGFGKAREGVVLSLLRVTEAEGDENCKKRASRCIARACGAVGNSAKALAGVLVMGSTKGWDTWKYDVGNVGRSGLGCYGRPEDVLQLPRTIMRPSLLGVLMARCLVRFPGGPGQGMRDSMANLSDLEILALSADAYGSRLIEQWVEVEPPSSGGRIAAKVMNAIAGNNEMMGILAAVRSPYGAQIVIKCSFLISSTHRKKVMDVLASNLEGLKNHVCGQMVVRKCRVERYIRAGEQWENNESAKEVKQRMFAEILEDDGEEVPKAKARKERKRKRKEQPVISGGVGATSIDLLGNGNSAEPQEAIHNGDDVEDGADEVGLGVVLGAIEKVAEPEQKKKKKKRRKKSD